MIAVDTSALMVIVLNEPKADACAAALVAEDRLLISAGTVAEGKKAIEELFERSFK